MKNTISIVLLCMTLAFVTFVAGFYTGRNTADTRIEISGYTTTAPAIPVPPASSNTDTDPSSTQTTDAASPFPININTATLEDLDLIPGIGPVIAQRILDYREEIGQFTHVEELLDVSGIGEKTLAKMLQYITL
jgi:competence protein ComEA